MSYNFKNLAEVELLTEVPEGCTAFAEVDGVVKRVPSKGLGSGSMFVATFNIDSESGEITCDKTFEECLQAHNENCLFLKLRTYYSGSYGMRGYMLADLSTTLAVENSSGGIDGFFIVGSVFDSFDTQIQFMADGTISV